MGALLAVLILPFVLLVLLAAAAALYQDLSSHAWFWPVVVLLVICCCITGYKDWKRRQRMRAHVERTRAAARAGKA